MLKHDFVLNAYDSCAAQIGLRWRTEKEVTSGKGINLVIYICLKVESYLFSSAFVGLTFCACMTI